MFVPKMLTFWVILLISLSLYQCVPSKLTPEHSCESTSSSGRTLKLSLNNKKNQSNEWVDTFTAWAETSSSSNRMDVDLTHSVFECEGKRVVFIQGVTSAPTIATADERFSFHIRCGKNAAILDKGRTAQKISNDDAYNSQLFSNRPLRNNEIFEVRLDTKNSKFNYCLGIGIITRSADEVDILPEMFKSPFTWIYHHGNIYSNAAEQVKNYGKDLNQLQVGDRVGVMRSEFGTLHFFVNGVDQGPAASNIPSPVYAIVELWYNAKKVSIVDSTNPK